MLDNGLTLLVQEDHSVPVVGVHLCYNVGSRNEVRGKTGFAHRSGSSIDPFRKNLRVKQRTEAASPTPLSLERIFSKNGIVSARSHIERARQSWPGWRPFPEPVLNWVGSRMSELGRKEEAVQVQLLNVDLYPESAGAWAGLGASQEAFADKHAARQSFIRALELDPKNEAATAALQRLGKAE